LKHIKHILFWLGVLISAFGFIVGQSDRIPVVRNHIAKKYVMAVSAQRRLLSAGVITPHDAGFDCLVHAYGAALSVISIDCYKNAVMPIDSVNGPTMGTVVTLHLQDGKTISSDSIDLSQRIEQIKQSEFFLWSVIIFISGLIVLIIGRYLPEPTTSKIEPRARE
jgi:hypothetical protein